jgi:hypothetical protein
MALLRREVAGAEGHIKRLEGAARGKSNKGRLTTGPNAFQLTQAEALSQLKDIEERRKARKLRGQPRLPIPANTHMHERSAKPHSHGKDTGGGGGGFGGSDIKMFDPNDNDTDIETEANIDKSDVFGLRLGNLGHF